MISAASVRLAGDRCAYLQGHPKIAMPEELLDRLERHALDCEPGREGVPQRVGRELTPHARQLPGDREAR